MLSRLTVAVLKPTPGSEDDRTVATFIHPLLIGAQTTTSSSLEEQIYFVFNVVSRAGSS